MLDRNQAVKMQRLANLNALNCQIISKMPEIVK